MRQHHNRLPIAVLLAGLVPAIITCEEASQASDAAKLEALVTAHYEDIPAFSQALERLVLHLSGTPQPGVNITPTATGGFGSVSVDTDGDGTLESTIVGSLTFNNPSIGIAGGATIDITEIAETAVDITSGLIFYDVDVMQFTDATASIPSEGSRPAITASEGTLFLDLSNPPSTRARPIGTGSLRASWPYASGFVAFTLGSISGFADIYTDESGQIGIFVYGEDFEFTIP